MIIVRVYGFILFILHAEYHTKGSQRWSQAFLAALHNIIRPILLMLILYVACYISSLSLNGSHPLNQFLCYAVEIKISPLSICICVCLSLKACAKL